MTALATGPVGTVDLVGGWCTRTVCTPTGYLGTRHEADGLSVVLGDCVQERRHDSGGCTTVSFGPDGQVAVSCLSAPPALWVGRRETRLVPELPSCREALRLDPGDLLVVCSADVLEHLDHGLPHLVQISSGLADPVERAHALACDIGTATPAGAAVVAVYTPPSTSSRTTTEEETP